MNIHNANILDWARQYSGPKFHALLCDPPYHLTERPRVASGGFGGVRATEDRVLRKGFMGKDWDGGDVAFNPATWAALAEHLHPGAFGMAFSGSRGWHRMAVAIEDAGLIIHPTIFCWAYGSGFPKATRLDVALDRRAGAERATVGTKRQAGAKFKLTQELIDNGGFNDPTRAAYDVTAPATDAAQAWAGHRYGGQALKPAVEPIIVFQKPYAGRPLDSIVTTGAGALNIEAGRVASEISTVTAHRADLGYHGGLLSDAYVTGSPNGRWPANFALVHHPACGAACHADCAVRRLGAQSGELQSGQPSGTRNATTGFSTGITPGAHDLSGFGDSGTAARFFFNSDWMYERLEDADQVGYFAKASRAEREAGLDPRTIAMLGADDFAEATINDGRAKSIDNPYQRGETTRRNIHATVKPISLARWLATLLLPPAEYGPRRLLVPFAGVASEMIGAMLAGWEEIEGIELGADHVEIARARMAYWQQRRYELLDPATPLTVKAAPDAPDGQLDMFMEAA